MIFYSEKDLIQKDEIKAILRQEKSRGNFQDIEVQNISYLILYRENICLIYLDSESELDWEFSNNVKGDELEIIEYAINKISSIQQDVRMNTFPNNIRRNILIRLGNVLGAYISKDVIDDITGKIIEYMDNQERDITRKWFTVSCLIALAVLWSGHYMLCFLKLYGTAEIITPIDTFSWNYATYGSYGAVLSVMLNNGNLKFSCTAGRLMVFLDVISRMLVGTLGAFIVILAMDAGAIFSGVIKEEALYSFKILLSISAGFSERMAPSILSSLEDKTTGEENG